MVTVVKIFSLKKCIYELERKAHADYALTKAKHVSVVMLAGKSCRKSIRATSGTDAVVLVCRH